jgi:hypothetical protein
VALGRRLDTPGPGHPPVPAGLVALVDSLGQLIALAESNPSEGWVQPRKVFV